MPLGAARLSFLAKTAAAGVAVRNVVTAYGDAQVDTAYSQFGGASAYLDGTGDYVEIENDFLFGTSDDFTIEFWYKKHTTNTTEQLASNRGSYAAGHWYMQFDSSTDKIQWGVNGAAAQRSTSTFDDTNWHHVALVRDSSVFELFVDGASQGTLSGSYQWGRSGENYKFGAIGGSAGNISVDEIRISDTPRYTSAFTPSNVAFQNDANTLALVHCDGVDGSTTFTDDEVTPLRTALSVEEVGNAQISTAQSQFGGTSAVFDGSGDHLETPVFELDGDYTVECWARWDTVSGSQGLLGSDATSPYHSLKSSGTTVYTNFGNIFIQFDSAISTNTWYHIAVTRSGSSVRLFRDGVQQGSTATDTTTVWPTASNTKVYIGRDAYTDIDGYVDEVRISDTARYTSNFTPSTTPFINDTNTLLLMHMDGTNGNTLFTDDNGKGRARQRIGFVNNAQISNVQSRFGASSAYFDGVDDIVAIGDDGDSNYVLWPRTGTFTVELWARPADTSFQQLVTVYGAYGDANPAGRSWIGIDSSNKWTFSANGGPTIASSSNASTTAWTHLAIVRNGSNQFEFFVDGVSQGTSTSSYTLASGYVSLAANANAYGLDYEGYIDEFRISDSVRYTGNFTPSTSAFTNDANTLVLLHFDDSNGSTDTTDDNGVY